MSDSLLKKIGLKYNPFEPSASGAPVGGPLKLPSTWLERLREIINRLSSGRGVTTLAISGEYGSGKTYILQWLYRELLPEKRIKAFYFDNPGVQFYDLANYLLRQIGRKNFAKSLWELVSNHITGYQRDLFKKGYEAYLENYNRGEQSKILNKLQTGILKAGVTEDDEIAFRLARIVAETPSQPYFEYQDFISGQRKALVAEKEEARYFGAILKTLRLSSGIDKVAFLIDEFEEVSLQKRLTRRGAHDYLATLKRLINLTQTEKLLLVIAMTPDSVSKTSELEPSLWERFTKEGKFYFEIPPLETNDAFEIIKNRLESARLEGFSPPGDNPLYPFSKDMLKGLKPSTMGSPRRLIKTCFYAIVHVETNTVLPFNSKYIDKIENTAYPASVDKD